MDAEWDAVLDLGGGGGAQAAGRRWPVGPDGFDGTVETLSSTNGSDRDAVKGLFRKMSGAQLGGVQTLDFQGTPRPRSPPTRPGSGAACCSARAWRGWT